MSIFGRSEPSAAEKFDRFLRFEEEMRPRREAEAQRIAEHAPRCYGTYGQCISCGCSRSNLNACVSHHNTIAYQADVSKRLIEVMESRA
ncbi:MAG: hypothetical protein Q8Q29_00550 [Actinomycetota bacterium]|nr:hypothetical protein [Actinomycetota bacterium]